jgi:hypothetical protein
LHGVRISSSISLLELDILTIVDVCIPIMATFNFFLNLSLKVSCRYTSYSCCGIITHSYKKVVIIIFHCFVFPLLHFSQSYYGLSFTMHITKSWNKCTLNLSAQVATWFVVS